MEKVFGQHYIVDFNGCTPELLERVEPLREILLWAARDCGATVVNDQFQQYDPVGVSGVVLIAESHLSIHTWPEDAYASVDIFTCGAQMRAEVAIEIIARELHAKDVSVKQLTRGHTSQLVDPASR